MNGKRWAVIAAVVAAIVPLLVALVTTCARLGALTERVEVLIGEVSCLRQIPERVAALEAAQRSLEKMLELYAPTWRGEGSSSG